MTLIRTDRNEARPTAQVPASMRLRRATAARHARLEADLDLLAPSPDRARFTLLLARFHGFHTVWEPAMAERLRPMIMGSARLPALKRDLLALGMARAEIAALPTCEDARLLAADPATALGSLYVLEGSRLGGRLIDRHLRLSAPWLPADGLAYFAAGPGDGGRWRDFCAGLDDAADAGREDALLLGACRTFELLHAWLKPAFRTDP